MMPIEEVLKLFFPQGIFEWFELKSGSSDEQNVYITLEEKDVPPLTEDMANKKIVGKKFHDITITDFPLRGKRTLITLRRRYWKVEGQESYVKRDMKFEFPGTQLEKEFALFLKEDGGAAAALPDYYRKVSMPPSERI
jgi:hypothetical protein